MTIIQNANTSMRGLDSRYQEVHAFWLTGMSCDGCTVAVAGATSPTVEDLLNGKLPGLPKVILHHPVLSVESGHDFIEWYRKAWRGELDVPYVIIVEGSVPDERIAKRTGGYFSAMGVESSPGENSDPWTDQPVSAAEWIRRLAPGAAATIAIGTCATWGGIPAAAGNVTSSMGVMDFLGREYLSALGLPVINVPGCAPIGDNFTELVGVVLMFLQGLGPLPEFDELGRPAWLFTETVHRGCTRAGSYEEGVFAEKYGDPECLVEIGCWGPVVQCNMVSRGAINGIGGCMKYGGICIGCTMPGFPDRFAPFYKAPPGSGVSGTFSRFTGMFVRPLRRISQRDRNRTSRWNDGVPSGWARVDQPGVIDRVMHFFYQKLQYAGSSKLNPRSTPESGSQKDDEPNKDVSARGGGT